MLATSVTALHMRIAVEHLVVVFGEGGGSELLKIHFQTSKYFENILTCQIILFDSRYEAHMAS